MKKTIRFTLMIIILLNYSCVTSKKISNDVSCFREINTDIKNELKNLIGNEYDSKESNIKLILKFYVNVKSKTDSIVVAKSNLGELNIDEKILLTNLQRYKYTCIREVYYSNELKPNYITVIFNPKLIN